MANNNIGVHVTGIPELSRALKSVNADLARDLKKGMKKIADHVIGDTQQKMPHRTGAAQRALRPRSTQKGAGIAYPKGGAGAYADPVGYYPWLDFGGGRREGRGVSPVGDRRGRVPDGRYLWPTVGESRTYIAKELYELIEDVAERHRFEVRG